MDNYWVNVAWLIAALSGCARPPEVLATPGTDVNTPQPRPRPPIAASNCEGLTREEFAEARQYLSKLSRVEPQYRDESLGPWQSTLEHPEELLGINLYMPAERGINRAYLERLLSCHAIQPPQPYDHPNDPLFSPGIVSVDVQEADGGLYRISIIVEDQRDGIRMLRRARMLQRSTGSVEVQQVEP